MTTKTANTRKALLFAGVALFAVTGCGGGAAAHTAPAAPAASASADNTASDNATAIRSAFLDDVQVSKVAGAAYATTDPAALVSVAQAICTAYDAGATTDSILVTLNGTKGVGVGSTDMEKAAFLGEVVGKFCPQHLNDISK